MNILVIDDDLDLLKLISNALKNDYSIDTESDVSHLSPNDFAKYELIILDVMMPKISGFEFLSKYRHVIDAPIILLTAKDFEKDKIEGFALGADDYITKPFSLGELRARVAAHLRRESRDKHSRLTDFPISCDLQAKTFYCHSVALPLSPGEYKICELLLKNKGQVFSKETIYTNVYGYDAIGDSQTSVTERIKCIRTKFHAEGIDPIKTIWGVGYKWELTSH